MLLGKGKKILFLKEIPIVTVISIYGMLGPNSLEMFKSYIDAAFKPRYIYCLYLNYVIKILLL